MILSGVHEEVMKVMKEMVVAVRIVAVEVSSGDNRSSRHFNQSP
jgi:hypothetical protein